MRNFSGHAVEPQKNMFFCAEEENVPFFLKKLTHRHLPKSYVVLG
jgi:hypothetical protein